jgi:putative nucleotidyltransferase with HDIG domain
MKDENVLNYLLNATSDELREKVRAVLEPIWSEFVEIPASKTGKYHPDVSNLRPYGLVNHTLRVIWFCERFAEEEKLDNTSRAEIAAAAILHDIGKIYYHKPGGCGDHGIDGSEMARKAGLNMNICEMIRNHMAHWEGKPLNNVYQRILAYADYLASRKEIAIAIKYFIPDGE